MKRYDVLVVDDEQVVCEGVERILRAEGRTVDTALDVRTALEKLEAAEYGIVITDLMMPDIPGMELIGILHKKHPTIPSIMITGYATVKNALDALRAGACDYVMKPFTYDEIAGATERGLRYAALRREGRKPAEAFQRPPQALLLKEISCAVPQDDGSCVITVDRAYLETIDEVSRVDFSEVEKEVKQGGLCAQLIVGEDRPFNIWSPLSGRVLAFNEQLAEHPALLREDPYGRGWLLRIHPQKLEEERHYLISTAV